MKARQVDKAAPATINREVEHLRTAFRIAVESGKLARVPIFPKALTEANARRGFFERSEFMAVLDHIKDADVRDFLEFFYWTGMRPGEIKSLVWSDFDRETMNLRLHESNAKNEGDGRSLPRARFARLSSAATRLVGWAASSFCIEAESRWASSGSCGRPLALTLEL